MSGLTENAGVENEGGAKTQGWKCMTGTIKVVDGKITRVSPP